MTRYFKAASALSMLISMFASTGCTDELPADFGDSSSDKIRFAVSVNDGGNSRSALSGYGQGTLTLTDGTAGGDTLYLHSEISAYPDMSALSRGSVAASGSSMYDEIEIGAYFYADGDSWDNYYKSTPNYLCDQTAKKTGATAFNFSETRYWPKNGKMRFVAYAPSIDQSTDNRDELQAQVPRNYWFDAAYTEGPRMYVRVPLSVKDQQDLLVAYTGELDCSARTTVPINFQHPLTCIKFECADDMIDCTIKKISFGNVCSDGNFVFDMNDADAPKALSRDDLSSYPATASPKFEIWGNLDTFTLDFGDGIAAGAGASLSSAENMFFMLPQKFDTTQWPWNIEGNGAPTLNIELEHVDKYTGETLSRSVSAPLDGFSWPAGVMVTYTLSFKDEILEVGEPKTFSYRGYVYDGNSVGSKDNTVSVKSLYADRDRDWDFEIMGDGANWLSGTKSADGKSITFNVKDNSNVPVALDINANLQKASPKGSSASPWNLSSATGAKTIENTANCYIVDAKGSYILPLVYGNGIANGTTNQNAYYFAGGELPNFKNHAGNDIFSPYIQSTWLTPTKAYVLWEDVDGLVTDVTLKPNYFAGGSEIGLPGIYGIQFNVAPSITIRQGNAVIAVEGSDGNIMWSWHIWVTNLDFSSSIENYSSTVTVNNADGDSFKLLTVNLGWCSDTGIQYYQKRSCQVKFTSDDLVQYVEVVQDSHLMYPRGNQTYYQWGRKDPFVGTIDGTVSKTWYDATGAHAGQTDLPLLESPDKGASNMTTRTALSQMILHPDKWHMPPYTEPGTISWGGVRDLKDAKDETYNNLWNNSATAVAVKTIYDPCPPGYMVAGPDIYSGLQVINYGDSKAEFSEAYTLYDSFQTLSFPSSGYRDWADNGKFFNFNVEPRGCVWSNASTPDAVSQSFNKSQGCAYYMNFTEDVMIPKDFFYTCDGFSVRPCAY